MKGITVDIEKDVSKNTAYRKIIYTTSTMQLVYMSIQPGEDIGFETHPQTTQFIRVEEGEGRLVQSSGWKRLRRDIATVIPPGTRHNIVSTGNAPLKLYTIYSPPEHPKGLVQKTKVD